MKYRFVVINFNLVVCASSITTETELYFVKAQIYTY